MSQNIEELMRLATSFRTVYSGDFNLARTLASEHEGAQAVQYPFFGGYTDSSDWYQIIVPEGTMEEAGRLATVNRILISCIDRRLSAQFLNDMNYQPDTTDLAIMVAGGAAQRGNPYRENAMVDLVKGILKFAPVHAIIAGVHTGTCAMVNINSGGNLKKEVQKHGNDSQFENDWLYRLGEVFMQQLPIKEGVTKKIAVAHVNDGGYTHTSLHTYKK